MKTTSSILLFLFLSGCTLLYPADPLKATMLLDEAEKLIASKDYVAAADRLEKAIRYQPENGTLYLRLGELLETTDQSAAARRIYTAGLKKTASSTHKEALAHRLAKLLILKLDADEDARDLLTKLPAPSARHHDLLGLLALARGQSRESLLHFNAALAEHPDNDLTATILYHAALAYHRLDDENNLLATLYQAINRANNLALIQDIEKLWNQTKAGAAKGMFGQPK